MHLSVGLIRFGRKQAGNDTHLVLVGTLALHNLEVRVHVTCEGSNS